MKFIVLLSAALYLCPAIAQSKFRNGFLLTLQNDTIRGLIKYKSNSRKAEDCWFSKSKSQPFIQYKPGEIRGFRFEKDQFYVTKSIGRSVDVFLEVLIGGTITLYRFNKIYFIEKADTLLFELSDDKDVIEMYGQRIKKKSKNFTRLLDVLMADCPNVQKEIPTVLLKEKQLVDLVHRYNQCIGSASATYRARWPGKQKRQLPES